jgi:hypothetical protein
MKKKPPGQKSIVTGFSLPPDLHAWLTAHASEPSPDPTSVRSASRIVQQALLEYRDRIEAEEREAETTDGEGPAKKRTRTKYSTAKAEPKADAGANAISPSASFATSSSMGGKARYPKAG